MKRALDISKHQGTFNALAAKAAGIEMVICRCAYGTSKDVKWDTFVPAVKAAGMELGAYGFLTAHYHGKNGGNVETAKTIMRQQVETWINLCKQQGCDILAVDQELEAGQSMYLSMADNTNLLIEACQLIETAGIKPLIYCSASWAKGRIDTSRCRYPLWVAYYYADPNDPDFGNCKSIEQVNTTYGRYMVDLGSQLYGWQFGRIGYGTKYGVGSANVDKNFIYKEDKPMDFKPIEGKVIVCTSASKPTCETFSSPDVNASAGKLELGETRDIIAVGDDVELAGMAGTWYKLEGDVYCLYLPDGRCRIEDKPVEPSDDLAEVIAALKRIEKAQTAQAGQISDLSGNITKVLNKLTAAGKALEG